MTLRPSAPVLALLLACSQGARAQTAALLGNVTDALARISLAGARVQVAGPDGQLVAQTVSDGAGRFRVAGLAPGRYVLVVRRVGYGEGRIDVELAAAETRSVALPLVPLAVVLDPLVFTASRTVETALQAPASVTVIERKAIARTLAFTPADHLRGVPGVDQASKGLLQNTFSVRGERSVNSGALLMLTDHRYAAVPSIGFNVPYLIPATNDDIERIEVTRGPGAALYGPNSHRGVFHVVTRSPFDSPGTSISVAGGDRSVFQGTLRHGAVLGDRVGVKLSGEYFRGNDWPGSDPLEVRPRDPVLARAAGEGRLDWRAAERTTLIAAAGVAEAIGAMDLTTVGPVQVRHWRYRYLQGRLERERLFANLMYNGSDAGETFQLRTGARIVDRSRIVAAQVQNGTLLRGWLDVRYGLDARRTNPRTGGTIHGRNEDRDVIGEYGAYVHGRAAATPRLDLVLAVRGDYHDRLGNLAVSPRVGVVFRPAPAHALRLTYNRAFNSPDPSDLFADIVVDSLPLPYAVRLLGAPKDGLSFRSDCGGLCMRSPFNPAGPAPYLPAQAPLMWSAVVEILKDTVDLSGIPPPAPTQVDTDLRVLNPETRGFEPFAPDDVTSIPPHRREITHTLELGYKAALGSGVVIGVDLYRTRTLDLLGPFFVGTPSVFFNEATLGQYLSNYMSSAQAAQLAQVITQIPVGTVAPQETNNADLLLLRHQGGAVTLWGVDLMLGANLTQRLSVSATYSWVSDDSVANVAQAGTWVLSAPRQKAGVALAFRNRGSGVEVALSGRAVASFPVASGVYRGRVESYEVVDLDLGARVPGTHRTRASVSVYNLFDHRHREFVGGPELGRLAVARLHTEF